jgi:hypothetical protein
VCTEIMPWPEQLRDPGSFPASVKIFSTEGSNRIWDHPVPHNILNKSGAWHLTRLCGACAIFDWMRIYTPQNVM